MDAFSGDSVPTHLLTIEAMQVYLRHLKTDGLLAVNISNRYLDLRPVVAAAAGQRPVGGARLFRQQGATGNGDAADRAVGSQSRSGLSADRGG